MNITLTIQEADYGFVVEAIKLRTTSMLESFNSQVARQKQPAIAAAPVKAEGAPVSFTVSAPKTKRKNNAPYGYKKDGTPKKKPGPVAGF